MDPPKTAAIDLICGMTVDTNTALHADRYGETSYFFSEHCHQKSLGMPADTKPAGEAEG